MIFRGPRVAPLTKAEIAVIADDFRKRLGLNDQAWFPIVDVIETVAKDGFEVVDVDEMPDKEGVTNPDLGTIKIRLDIYDAACKGDGHGREVCAHELAHWVMHRDVGLACHSAQSQVLRLIEDGEWQAEQFSSLLLAPNHIIRGFSAVRISEVCGVKLQTALNRVRM